MQRFIIIFVILFLTSFFGFFFVARPFRFIVLAILIAYSLINKTSHKFDKVFILYFCGLLLSIISCFYFRGQNPINSVVAYIDYWGLGLFYFFSLNIFSVKDLKWCLNFLGIALVTIYLLQYVLLQYGIAIKDVSESVYDNGTMNVRFRIGCSAAIFLLYFEKIKNFIELRRKMDLLIILLIITVVLIMNFRSILLGGILSTIFVLWRLKINTKRILQFIIGCSFLSIVMLNFEFVNLKIEQMVERHESETFENDDYVRVRTYDYFNTEHFKSSIERFLGSGLNDGHSEYNDYMIYLYSKGIHFSDFGLLGVSWIFGIITSLSIFLYVIKAVKLTYKDDIPVCSWFLFLLTVSFLTYEIARSGNFIIQALVLSLIVKEHTGCSVNYKDEDKTIY